MTEDKRREKAIDKIPSDWITRDEAISHIMNVEQCSFEEAEALFEEFVEMSPDSVKTLSIQ